MPNAFDTFNTARDNAFNQVEGIRRNRALRQAGQQLQAGDTTGAAGGLYGAGMLDEGLALERQQQGREDRTYEREKDAKDQTFKEVERKAALLKQVTEGLRTVPAGQRKAQLDRVLPVFQGMGIDTQPFAGLTEEDLSDQGLAAFGAEIDNQVKVFNTSSGVVAVDTGALERNLQDPNASRVVYQDPLAAELKKAQIGATNARAGASSASADASRARAAKTRTGGGSARGGVPPLPPGFVMEK